MPKRVVSVATLHLTSGQGMGARPAPRLNNTVLLLTDHATGQRIAFVSQLDMDNWAADRRFPKGWSLEIVPIRGTYRYGSHGGRP